MSAFEQACGGWIGPIDAPDAPLDFSAHGDAVWAAFGAGLFATRGIRNPAFPNDALLVARLLPMVSWWDGPPVRIEHVDRVVIAGGRDDIAIDATGAVLACGVSTRQAVVRVCNDPDTFMQRLALLLAPMARGWSRVRLRFAPRAAASWLASVLGLEPHPGGWRSDDALVIEGDWLSPEEDCAIVASATVARMRDVVSRLRAPVIWAQLEGRFDMSRVHAPSAAPPAFPIAISSRDAQLGLCTAGAEVIQHRARDGRSVVVERLDEAGWQRDTYLQASESLEADAVSPRCRAWLREHDVVLDRDRAMGAAELRSSLGGCVEPAAVDAAWAFESRYGGLRLTDATGEYWLGVGPCARGGHHPARGRVAIGAFEGGVYRLDAAGRVWVDDSVQDPFLIADSARRLVERFAIGQRYPECFFEWPGSYRIAIGDSVAKELADRLGAVRVAELSDELQSVYADSSVALWEPPEWAALSHPAAIAVCETAAARDRALEVLAALDVEASAE